MALNQLTSADFEDRNKNKPKTTVVAFSAERRELALRTPCRNHTARDNCQSLKGTLVSESGCCGTAQSI